MSAGNYNYFCKDCSALPDNSRARYSTIMDGNIKTLYFHEPRELLDASGPLKKRNFITRRRVSFLRTSCDSNLKKKSGGEGRGKKEVGRLNWSNRV